MKTEEAYTPMFGSGTINLHFGCGTNILCKHVNVDTWVPACVPLWMAKIRRGKVWGASPTFFVRLGCRTSLEEIPAYSCRSICSTHVLEHYSPAEVYELMGEFQRVLVPGGTMTHRVPDFDSMVRFWHGLNDPSADQVFDMERYQTVVNGVLCPFSFAPDYPPHKSLWGRRYAEFLFRRWGFVDIVTTVESTDLVISAKMPSDGLPYNTIRVVE